MQNNPPPNNPPPNYQQPGYGQQPGQPFGQPPKKSKLPWIIAGGLGCLVLVVVLLAALGGLAYLGIKADQSKTVSKNGNANRRTVAPRSADTGHYENTRAGRTGNLDKYYVDFSFDYPKTWKLDPDPAPSYVRVERTTPEDLTTENFSVGWFGATGNSAGNTALLSKMVNQLSQQVSSNFPGFEKVSEGATTINGYDGYEMRFRRAQAQTDAGQLAYWGRIAVITSEDDASRGVSLIMLATEKAEGVEGEGDVGEKGELRAILDSFRLGASQ